MKAHCWKHVWFIPGCWRCEAKEWRRQKDIASGTPVVPEHSDGAEVTE